MTVEITDDEELELEDEEQDDDDEEPAPEGNPLPPLDLSGVPPILRDLIREIEKENRPQAEASDIPAARRVFCNKDGSIGVKLLEPIKIRKDEEVDGIRLRPLRALDYFDGTTERIAEATDMNSTLRFANTFASPKGIVGRLACIEDMNAVYYGVMAARGNFSRPRT